MQIWINKQKQQKSTINPFYFVLIIQQICWLYSKPIPSSLSSHPSAPFLPPSNPILHSNNPISPFCVHFLPATFTASSSTLFSDFFPSFKWKSAVPMKQSPAPNVSMSGPDKGNGGCANNGPSREHRAAAPWKDPIKIKPDPKSNPTPFVFSELWTNWLIEP